MQKNPNIFPPIFSWGKLSEKEQREKLSFTHLPSDEVVQGVQKVLKDVEKRGDAALRLWSKTFDHFAPESFLLEEKHLEQAEDLLEVKEKQALEKAAVAITQFHQAQSPKPLKVIIPGGKLERIWRPLSSVGLYVPGGSAPLPSTMLMLGIPSQIAQCPLRIVCTPPGPKGVPHPSILYAAKLTGIQKVFVLGGAQAIAAMSLGTQSVPQVDKIFGPGNIWVTQAKRLVAETHGGAQIDMLAGPSEVLIIADEEAPVEWVAADLLAQAEHDRAARAILVSPSRSVLEKVRRACHEQLQTLPRRAVAEEALQNSPWFFAQDLQESFAISNAFAPEHLIVHVVRARSWLSHIHHAGAVFLGPWSPEALGDYAAGPNHVLPTWGSARTQSGLSLESFFKSTTVQEYNFAGIKRMAPTVEALAELEGLEGHRRSVQMRMTLKP